MSTQLPASEGLPASVVAIATAAAKAHGVDPALVLAVIWVESRGNALAVSAKGARGLMQLMPATSKDLGVVDAFDPAQNVDAGTRYLKRLLAKYGAERAALAAYNWGPGNVDRTGGKLPEQVETYVQRVLERRGGRGQLDSPFSLSSSGVLCSLRCPSCADELVLELSLKRGGA